MMRNFLISEHKVLRVMMLRYFVTYKLLSTHALCEVTGCNVFTVIPLLFHKGMQQSSDSISSIIKQYLQMLKAPIPPTTSRESMIHAV